MSEASILYETVIRNGYCIGCGSCAHVEGSPFRIILNEFGCFYADHGEEILENNAASVLSVCPFACGSKTENELSDIFFPEVDQSDNSIGKYISCFAGYVNVGDFRAEGSSGGIAKWLGYELLKSGEIDCFVQIAANESCDPGSLLFDYQLFSDANDVLNGSTSAYYPTTIADIIGKLLDKNLKYAITAVPCTIKALRLLSLQDERLRKRIKYTIGIVCGGLKSANYAKLVGWELGIHPSNLSRIEFRGKYSNRPANEKIYTAWSCVDGTSRSKDASQIYGTGYAAGFFKPLACDYCDDVLAETADIAIGDAWLKEYVQDPRGTSMIVVRHHQLLKLLQIARRRKDISLESIGPEDVASSQKGGLRHRREALSRRIAKKQAGGEWVPPKRIKANQYAISRRRRRIYDCREKIAQKSHVAFSKALQKDCLSIFHKEMNPLIISFAIANFYELLPKLPRRVYLFLKQKVKRYL